MNKTKRISQRLITIVFVVQVLVLFLFVLLCTVSTVDDSTMPQTEEPTYDTLAFTIIKKKSIDSSVFDNPVKKRRVLINSNLKTTEVVKEKEILTEKPINSIVSEKNINENELSNKVEKLKRVENITSDTVKPEIDIKRNTLPTSDFNVSETDPGKLLNNALYNLSQGDTIKARKQIAEIAEKNRKYTQAWSELARLSIIQHDRKQALKALKRLLSMAYTKKLQKNFEETIAFVEENKFNEALQQFEKLRIEKQFK